MNKEREQAETALDFLSTTDEKAVYLERLYKAAEQFHKEVEAAQLMVADGTVPEKKAKSILALETKEAHKAMLDAWQEWKNLVMRRNSAERRWEDWRSLNANRRQGGM